MLAKVKAAPGERVLLAVPAELRMSAAEVAALRRAASDARVGLALVTADPALRALAASQGIGTFRSEERGRRARWRRLSGEPPKRLRATGPAEAVVPYAPGLFVKRSPSGFRPAAFVRAFVERPSPWWATLGLTLCLLMLFGGLLYALASVIPAATLVLTPSSEPLQVTVQLKAVQDAITDTSAGIVPAQAMSVQVSGEARTETTGRRAEPATKAKGRVVFINRTGREIRVPIGSVVSTATGNNMQFATTEEVVLVAFGRVAVSAEAVLPGPSGNVRAGTITRVEGPLSLSLLVANEAGFSGGTTAPVGVVTEEDKIRLEAQLLEELKKQAFERLNERVEPGSFIPAESVTYLSLSPTFTPFVGEVSPELYLSMSVQAVGLVVDQAAANQVALLRMQAAMPPGSRLISESIRFIPGSVVLQDQQTVGFSVIAEGMMLRAVDTEAARDLVLGKLPEQAAAVLGEQLPLAQPAEIRLGPDWLPLIVPTRVPMLPWRVRVLVDWDVAAHLAMRAPQS